MNIIEIREKKTELSPRLREWIEACRKSYPDGFDLELSGDIITSSYHEWFFEKHPELTGPYANFIEESKLQSMLKKENNDE